MEPTIRYSKKREAILDALRGTRAHPSAEAVYQSLKPMYPDLSLGTVYRNLSLLRRQGLIRCVAVVNGQERFDAFVLPHSHFICDRCGAVIDLEVDDDPDLDKLVARRYGHQVDHHDLVFHGNCSNCVKPQ